MQDITGKGVDAMDYKAQHLNDEVLKLSKITSDTVEAIVLLRVINSALLAGATPKKITERIRRLEIEAMDSGMGKLSDLNL